MIKQIPADLLFINPDCGLKTRGWPEVEQALTNLVEAAKVAREVCICSFVNVNLYSSSWRLTDLQGLSISASSPTIRLNICSHYKSHTSLPFASSKLWNPLQHFPDTHRLYHQIPKRDGDSSLQSGFNSSKVTHVVLNTQNAQCKHSVTMFLCPLVACLFKPDRCIYKMPYVQPVKNPAHGFLAISHLFSDAVNGGLAAFLNASLHVGLVGLLDALGDRAGSTGAMANGSAVDLAHGDLRREGACDKDLVCGVDVAEGVVLFEHSQSQLASSVDGLLSRDACHLSTEWVKLLSLLQALKCENKQDAG